jgi:hypothetical protein
MNIGQRWRGEFWRDYQSDQAGGEPDREDPELRHALARIPEYGDRVLRVVYNQTTVPWRIITVYFDRTQRNRL